MKGRLTSAYPLYQQDAHGFPAASPLPVITLGAVAPAAEVTIDMDIAERFLEMKRQGKPITMLTAYDAPTARAQAEAGVDVILVGDSIGSNFLGYADERDVKLTDIAHHVRAVRRGAPSAVILADLPFGTYDEPAQAQANAKALREAGTDMVKFEGARPEIVAALRAIGIPVSGHIGLEPQHHEEKRLKGKTADAARDLFEQAQALDKAGVALMILELIPEELAGLISKAVRVPTIGIGAGRETDGQVLVVTDLLGFTPMNFRHNRRYAEVGQAAAHAFGSYIADVRARRFPAEENAFKMPKAERAVLDELATR